MKCQFLLLWCSPLPLCHPLNPHGLSVDSDGLRFIHKGPGQSRACLTLNSLREGTRVRSVEAVLGPRTPSQIPGRGESHSDTDPIAQGWQQHMGVGNFP